MKIKQGDIIIYSFPFLLSNVKNKIVGHVDFIGDDFIFIKSNENVRLKVSRKNFSNIKKIGSIEEASPSVQKPSLNPLL